MSRRGDHAVLARESAVPRNEPVWRDVAPGGAPDAPAVEELLTRVRAGGGPDGAGEPRFLPALGRLLRSLDTEAGLHAEGRRAAHTDLAAALHRQRRTIQLLRDRPEIARIDIRAPLFLTGLPGSGAALLHNALAEHPGLDAPTLAELHDPAGGPASPRRRREALERAGELARDTARTTAGRGSGLLLGATRPGGCHRLLGNAFHGMAATLSWHVPGYAAWLETADMTEAYTFHRAQLQAVAWRVPAGRPVLRDSFHARYLPQLLRVYPDAKVVQVHRDPADTVAACAGIATALRGRTARRPPRAGQEWADRVERHLVAAERARSSLSQDRLLDLRFEDLVADPAGQVRAVLAFAGVTATPLLDRVVAAFVAGTAREARRSRLFQPAEFGLSRRELTGRFSLYRARYRV
ncbi:sulfotransferase family protein [Streptomyces albidoflavus]|uniref:sulfotransferase family protein n=1 Tax=Streptomyces TaxID=1883 RepID=UPI001F508A6E|nr:MULTISPECIES: sulfotransferase [Streptomyces]MCU7707014.1 sulfotransferase [Streptomyces albidoflavus]